MMRLHWDLSGFVQVCSESKRTEDYTINELTPVAIDLLKSEGAIFLKVNLLQITFQFVFFLDNMKKLLFGYDTIQNIKSNILEYNNFSEVSISGSLLILMNGEAICMHHDREDIYAHQSLGSKIISFNLLKALYCLLLVWWSFRTFSFNAERNFEIMIMTNW